MPLSVDTESQDTRAGGEAKRPVAGLVPVQVTASYPPASA